MSGFKAIKNSILKVKALLISKNVLTFLVFLVLSGIFWFVHSLGRERESIINIPVNYIGIPEDVKIVSELPRNITIVIRDEGLRLLEYNKKKTIPLTLDLQRVYFQKGEILITADQLKTRLYSYVLPTTAVLSIKPDSIPIHYYKLATKDLKIKLNATISLANQYILSDSIHVEPSNVKVFGPRHIVDTMKAAYTEPVELKDIADTTLIKTKLRPITDVKYAFDDVNVGVFVEMFTEKKQQIPVTLINVPETMNIRVFPVMIEATYNIGLSNFNKIKSNDIQAVFDYNEVTKNQKRRHKLQVINHSPYISSLRFSPDEVEFLLEKK